jgi:hypothetical protein
MIVVDEQTLRALIDTGAVKQLHIVADGSLFHVNVITAKKGAITALTTKGTVKTWATLDAAAKWVRSLGIGKVHLDITHWQSQQKRLVL